MLVRKNTKEHGAVVKILEKYARDKNRRNFVKLYIIEAGKGLEDKIPVEKTGKFADVYYNLTFDSVLKNLVDEDHKFHKSDQQENLYYFESNFTPAETPFELASAIQQEVDALIKDKKFKVRKMKPTLTVQDEQDESLEGDDDIKSIDTEIISEEKHLSKKAKAEPQPDYHLDFPIHFSDLNKNIAGDSTLTKGKLLDYYDAVSSTILPFILNRPLLEKDIDEILKDSGKETQEWIKTTNIYMGEIAGEFILGQSKEHILFLIDAGVIELTSWLSKNKNFNNPDFMVISLIPYSGAWKNIVEVANAAKEILEICEIRGFLKTTGEEKLEVCVALNGKHDFNVSRSLAALLSKLIIKKAPEWASLDEGQKEKIFLDTSINALGSNTIVPYSVNRKSPTLVAALIDWSELREDFDYKNYTIGYVLERLNEKETFLQQIIKSPLDGKEILDILERRYGFLL
ncbi:MAG TPA: hypothetical protein VD908_14195 [Cytophagales bacterium]|nr:hypothetical protein [Cytophagales bacterium]